MANVTPNLGLPLDINGKVEFEQAITKSLGLLSAKVGIPLPVRTEGMFSLRETYKNAMLTIGTTIGLTLPTQAVDAGMLGFKQTYIAQMTMLDSYSFGVGGSPKMASASTRTRQAFGANSLGATAANNWGSGFLYDYNEQDVTGARVYLNADYIDPAQFWVEIPSAGIVEYGYSFLTNLTGDRTTLNQSAATRTNASFNDAQSGTTFLDIRGQPHAPLRKRTGIGTAARNVPATWAELLAALQAIDNTITSPLNTANNPATIRLAPGFGIWSDAGPDIPQGGWRHLIVVRGFIGSTSVLAPGNFVARGQAGGDYNRAAGSHALAPFQSADWSAHSAFFTGSGGICGPLMVMGTGASGKPTVVIGGNSIAVGDLGDNAGNSKGALGYLRRGYSDAGVPTISSAQAGSNAADFVAGTVPSALYMRSFADREHFEHGHNRDTNVMADNRAYVQFVSPFLASGKTTATTLLLGPTGGIVSGAGTLTSIVAGGGTTATATTSAAHGMATGDFALIFSTDVTGWDFKVAVTVTSATTFTFTCPAGLTDSAAGKWAKRGVPATSVRITTYNPYLRAKAFNQPGDPTFAFDAELACRNVANDNSFISFYSLKESRDGTHPIGLQLDGVTSGSVVRMAAALTAGVQEFLA